MSNDSVRAGLAILDKIRNASLQLNLLQEENVAVVGLWEVAVKKNQGELEHELRQRLHGLLDQIMDQRSATLQLVKDFEKIPPSCQE